MENFPEFEILTAEGQSLTTHSAVSLSFSFGFGMGAEIRVKFGVEAREVLERAGIGNGMSLSSVKLGFADDLKLIARNALVWDDSFKLSSSSGAEYEVTAYGCSVRLRNSGKRTLRLNASTFADAVKEVASRHGLKVRIAGQGGKLVIPEDIKVTDPTQDTTTTSPVASSTATKSPIVPKITPDIPLGDGNIESVESLNALTAVRTIAMMVATGRGKFLSTTALREPNYCARFVREVVEFALGKRWQVYSLALTVGSGDNIEGINANDYEEAALQLGLRRKGEMFPGDILFNHTVSPPWGHVGIYVGVMNGIPSVIENTSANRGTAVFGSGPVRLTPLFEWGTVTSVIRPVGAGTAKQTALTPAKPDASSGLAGKTISATAHTPQGQVIQQSKKKNPIANFAALRIADLLAGSSQTGVRRVFGGASNLEDAKHQGLDYLALAQLRYCQVNMSIKPNFALRPGMYADFLGDEVPTPYKGRYLITAVSGEINGENGATMSLTLNRNVAQ